MEHIAQGKRSDTLGDPTTNNIDAPWKGKSIKFQDEYRQFLLSYGVEYDEAYVFKD